MVNDLYQSILDALVVKQGVETRGFHRAMRGLVQKYVVHENFAEEVDIDGTAVPTDIKAWIDDEMGEWFGCEKITIKPAAFRIVGGESLTRPEVHLYEIAASSAIPQSKLQHYGWWADADPGIDLTLHIVNEYGHELVLPCAVVMCFSTQEPRAVIREFISDDSSMFAVPPQRSRADERLPDGYVPTEKQKRDAAYRALKELGITL